MNRFVAGLVLGLVLATAGVVIVYARVRDAHYAHGVEAGRIEGRLEVIEAVGARLGTHPRVRDRRTLLEAKTSELVVVTVEGVETVRAVAP